MYLVSFRVMFPVYMDSLQQKYAKKASKVSKTTGMPVVFDTFN